MKKLEIRNFKAFGDDPATFGGETKDGKPMNVLCYGENGAGKSSVFEAIKFVFHYQRILRDRHIQHLSGEAFNNALRQLQLDYRNKKSRQDFTIKINGTDYQHFNATHYHAYLINGDNITVGNQIDVKILLKNAYLAKHNIETELTQDFFDLIVEETNRILTDYFYETITVAKSQNGDYMLRIDDDGRDIHQDGSLKNYFNEAKLHLVALLFLLASVQLMAPHSEQDKRLLVLDDFITSLDMANRTFLYRYISEKFDSFQIVILTHNTSFYNLCDHLISEDSTQHTKWLRQGQFEYNGKHTSYADDYSGRIEKLEQQLKDHPEDLHNIGNGVRQYFEVLLHQLSMLLMAGAKEETNYLLAEITKKANRRYFHIENGRMLTTTDLVDSLMHVIDKVLPARQLQVITEKLNQYRANQDTDALAENLKAMAIYQKVALHQSSHGHQGLPDMSAKEIKASFTVLRKLEDTIRKMKVERI